MKLDSALTGVSSSNDLGELYAALNKAQAMYLPIKRSGHNKVENFRYATLRDIVDATLPGLLANGFTMPTFQMGRDEKTGQWIGVGTLHHASGEWISSACPLLMGYENARPGIQLLEINITYAKKILMQGLCGGWMDTDEESEEELNVAAQAEAAKPTVTEMVSEKITAPRVAVDIAASPEGAAEGGEVTPEVTPPVSLPAPVKQQKKSKSQPPSAAAIDLLKRAEAAFVKHKGSPEQTTKVVAHLKSLVDMGSVPSSQAMTLTAKYVLDAEVVRTLQREVPDAE
jgi:hypothetical protein